MSASHVAHPASAEFARPCTIGAVIGFVVLTAACTVLGMSSGFDDAGSLGMALVGGMFGGIGFGAMFGAIVAITRAEVKEREAEEAAAAAAVPSANAHADEAPTERAA